MSDEQFLAELKIRAYIDQIDGYPIGHPARINFKPIVPTVGRGLHLDRLATLNLPAYHKFTSEQQGILLSKGV